MPVVGVFASIFDAEGRILCVRQRSGQRRWNLPGGRMEAGETPIEALVREVREETGYVVTVGELIGVYSIPYRNSLALCFHATAASRGPWRANTEIVEIGFFGREELPTPMRDHIRARIEDAFDGRRSVVRVIGREVERRPSRKVG